MIKIKKAINKKDLIKNYAEFLKNVIKNLYKNIIPNDELKNICDYINLKNTIKEQKEYGLKDYIILDNNKTIGIFQIKPQKEHIELTRIYIDKDYQNKGIGKNILKKIKKLAKKCKIKKIVLFINQDFKKSIEIFEKSGFSIIEPKARYIGSNIYLYEYYLEYNI